MLFQSHQASLKRNNFTVMDTIFAIEKNFRLEAAIIAKHNHTNQKQIEKTRSAQQF
jgi:hypothetical protein